MYVMLVSEEVVRGFRRLWSQSLRKGIQLNHELVPLIDGRSGRVIALNDFQGLFHHPLLLIQKKLTGFSFGNNGLQLIEGFLG